MEPQRPQVGVGLLLIKGTGMLLGKRKSAHAHGEYAGFGGHLELLETYEECVMRELREEGGTKLQIKNLRFLCTTNLRAYAPRHYIDIGMVADWVSGEPEIMEPDKIESWEWYDLDHLPSPLFGVIDNYVQAYRHGDVYFNN